MADDKREPTSEIPTDETPRKGPGGALGGLVQAESMVQLALAIPGGCFVGLLIGHLLDKHFGTKWMVIAGMLLGAAGGFVQLFTVLGRSNKRGDE